MFSLTGTLKVKKETQQVTDSFKKREFVVTENSSQYPQHISFQLIQDKCELLDAVAEQEQVTVHFFVRGREWTAPDGTVKYFNSLDAWKVEKVGAAAPAAPEGVPADSFMEEEGGDDLPF